MLTIPGFDSATLVSFLLILTRVGGLFATAPLLSQLRVPTFVKASICFVVALLLYPVVAPPAGADPGLGTLVGWVAQEFLVGALLGFVAALIFAGIATGGQIVGFQMGLTYAGAVDPQFNSHMSPVADVLNLAGLLLFLALDGHHHLFRALALSYNLAPAGAFAFTQLRIDRIIAATAGIFVLALQIAAPVIVLLVLTDVALGLLSRMVPQMNIFVVGAPLKIAVGIFMLAVAMPFFGSLLTALFTDLDRHLLTVLGGT